MTKHKLGEEFCVHCGASFPHRYGEGRCGKCLPKAFNQLDDEVQRLREILERTGRNPSRRV